MFGGPPCPCQDDIYSKLSYARLSVQGYQKILYDMIRVISHMIHLYGIYFHFCPFKPISLTRSYHINDSSVNL